MKRLRGFLPALGVISALLILWEAYVRAGFISPSFLPPPSAVFQAIVDYRGILWENTLQTIEETLIGLALAVFLGLVIGIAIFWSARLKRAVYPLLVLSQTIPMIALAPLLIIWFGFDLLPKVIIVVLYCFFPVAVAVSDGLANAPPQLNDLMKSLKASRWQSLRYVQLPAALDSFFSGLKISATYAVTGAIVGEYVGAYKGLGIYMQTAANSHVIVVVFASLFVIVWLTLLLLLLVALAQRKLMPWKYAHEE
jgi:ABC-type nitrate/sulfonate/bicarbonate transport system permease component